MRDLKNDAKRNIELYNTIFGKHGLYKNRNCVQYQLLFRNLINIFNVTKIIIKGYWKWRNKGWFICLANNNFKTHPHKNTTEVIDIFNLVKTLNPFVGGTCNTREIALATKNFSIFYVLSGTHISRIRFRASFCRFFNSERFNSKTGGRSTFISSISNHRNVYWGPWSRSPGNWEHYTLAHRHPIQAAMDVHFSRCTAV